MIGDPTTKACDNVIDPLGGATIPSGIVGVESFVNGQAVWATDPPTPPAETAEPVLLQSGGPLLIEDGVSLLITA